MEEKHGNVYEMFEPKKEGEPTPDIHFYLNWKCDNPKCGAEYGTQPSYCHGCGCNSCSQIEPKYQSLMR